MCHVLIIEDEMIAALDIQSVLKRSGASSFAFADTEREAVERARERRPAVIVSDVMLASGSGVEAVRAILSEQGRTPVIFLTATPFEVEGFEPLLVEEKPFSPARLSRMFRAAAPAG